VFRHFDPVEASTLANADWDADIRKAFELGSFKRSGSGTDRGGDLLTDRTVDSVEYDSEDDSTKSTSTATSAGTGSGGLQASTVAGNSDAAAASTGSDLKVPTGSGATAAPRRRRGVVPPDISSITRLPYEAYCDSLFEVADIWYPSLSPPHPPVFDARFSIY
jgi:hypothetical protein